MMIFCQLVLAKYYYINRLAFWTPQAWLYDNDFDGTIDEGEYLGPGVEMPVPEIEGAFVIKSATGEKRLLKKDLQGGLLFLSGALSEANALLAQGK